MVTVRTIGPIAEEYNGFKSAATEKTWRRVMHAHHVTCTRYGLLNAAACCRSRVEHRQSCTIWTLSKCKLSLRVPFGTFLIWKLCYKEIVASGVNLWGLQFKGVTTVFSLFSAVLPSLKSEDCWHSLLTLGGVFHISRLSGFGLLRLVGG